MYIIEFLERKGLLFGSFLCLDTLMGLILPKH